MKSEQTSKNIFTYNRSQVFPIFKRVLLRLLNMLNIVNFAVQKLYLAKLTRVIFKMTLHAKGLKL